MKNMIWKNIICLLLLLLSVVGCGQNVPDGFPEVVPLTVWITDGGKPLNEVFVVLEMVPPVSNHAQITLLLAFCFCFDPIVPIAVKILRLQVDLF
jgi:hypothetical protein